MTPATPAKRRIVQMTDEEYEAFCFVVKDYKVLIERQRGMEFVPDWDVRLRTFKILLTLMSKDQKQKILDGLLGQGYTNGKIISMLGNCLDNCTRPRSLMLRSEAQKKRWKILKRDKFTCQYCGRKPPEVILHVDHKIPISRGGDSSDKNLITSCLDCNLGKFVDIL